MKNHAQAELAAFCRGDEGVELVLDFDRIPTFGGGEPLGEAESLGAAQHVGVDGEPGQVEVHAADHVAGLATDAGQGDQVLERLGTSPS